ncbi:MAG: sugar phosphate isomerase/epimerase [Methanophagales archaeon]|nr:sugar phosphate isomerase/epimerase [Methanophagales archaeon]
MGILLGAPVWYGNRPFERTIKELYKLGVDYFEFSLDYPLPDCMDEAERKVLKGLLEEFELKIGFHSPLDVPLAHPRDELADASRTVLRRCMEFSAEFLPLSQYYNFHVNPRVSTFKLRDVREVIRIKGLERCKELTRMASEFGIVASVENDLVPFEWSDLLLEALSLLYPNLYLTFDVGHAIMAEMIYSRMKRRDGTYLDYLKRWIEKCGAKILVVHVHDCSCTGNELQDHLSLGSGELDFDAVFELVRSTTCKYLVIETFWKNKDKMRMDYEEVRRNIELCRSYL